MTSRVRLRRTKGWRKPARTIVVTRSSKWGNPHKVTAELDRAQAVERFRVDLLAGRLPFTVEDVQRELVGRDLACWCPLDEPCHADVLLAVARNGNSMGTANATVR
jgi:hypothetical protein